jgi:hypothetical protein
MAIWSVCDRCGLAPRDTAAHEAWHEELSRLLTVSAPEVPGQPEPPPVEI